MDEMESSVQKHAKQIEEMRERLLSLERYSREYNLRFHNVFTLSYDPTLRPFPNKIELRDFKRFDKNAFQKALRNANWTPVYKSYDVNESLTRFFHTVNSISNSYAPLKSFDIKNKSDKPWVTNELRKSIKIRKELYKKWLTTRNIYYHKQYKIYRNKIVSINKALRTLYYDSVLKDSTKTKKCGIMLTV